MAAVMRARLVRSACAAALLCVLAASAAAQDIKLTSMWMRPAEKGSTAKAYVDIASDAPLTLVGATTPLARKVELVKLTKYDGTDPGKVVTRIPVEPGTPTRLAYKGSHLRLVGVRQDLLPGAPVPVTLQFRDKAGKRVSAQADIRVHGVALPMPPQADRAHDDDANGTAPR
jgi:copper(I)-binding protein